ncbi:MAG: enoyl-CoA hydratase [Proteobacteria bacterium]|nr:enoyl-CoA hydratase [Pseudomonadota bacterium]
MSSQQPAAPAEERVRVEHPAEGVARIVLARPEARNAQDKRMTYALNDAFDAAAHDDAVKAIILAADGPHFSSGHDLRDREPMEAFEPVGTWGGFEQPGAEGHFAVEQEIYLGLCWRWRNLPKPTIAEVQGKTIAGGLMLAWVCDLIVASDDASFSDPVVAFGVNGVEYFAHPWEVGVRKAKEMLFTGDAISAAEAKALGMVNHVVPRAELADFTLALAARIARRPSMGLKLAKQSVNQTQDAQGLWNALQAAMSLQQLGHSHNQQVHGMLVDPAGAAVIRKEAKEQG